MITSESAGHEIRFRLSRSEWLKAEWPALLMLLLPSALLLGIGLAARRSAWWALLLVAWWPLGGARALGLVWFLVGGGSEVCVRVLPSGVILAAENGAEPRYAHWVGFQESGDSFVLWGGDGRYRLVLPRRALTPADHAALRERTGVDLMTLGPRQEARIRRAADADGPGPREPEPS